LAVAAGITSKRVREHDADGAEAGDHRERQEAVVEGQEPADPDPRDLRSVGVEHGEDQPVALVDHHRRHEQGDERDPG
jgi:hypothetical protein